MEQAKLHLKLGDSEIGQSEAVGLAFDIPASGYSVVQEGEDFVLSSLGRFQPKTILKMRLLAKQVL